MDSRHSTRVFWTGTIQIPGVSVGVSVVDQGASGLRVSWKPTVGSTSYEVWRNTTAATGTATRIGRDVVGGLYYDTTAVSGTSYYYWVKAVNPAGASAFNTGNVTVNPTAVAPVIAFNPASQTVNAGTSVTLLVQVASNAPVSYQWRKGGAAIAGATKGTLALNPLHE